MRKSHLGPRVALLGALVGIAGCALPWYSVSNGVTIGTTTLTGTPSGAVTVDGLAALIATGFALLLGLVLTTGRARRLLGSLVMVAGVVTVAAAMYAIANPLKGYIDFASRKAAASAGSASDIRLSLASLFRMNHLRADVGIGAIVSLVGGALVVIGGLLVLVAYARRRQHVNLSNFGGSSVAPGQVFAGGQR